MLLGAPACHESTCEHESRSGTVDDTAAFMTGGDLYPNPGAECPPRKTDLDTQIVIAMVCFRMVCPRPA